LVALNLIFQVPGFKKDCQSFSQQLVVKVTARINFPKSWRGKQFLDFPMPTKNSSQKGVSWRQQGFLNNVKQMC